MLVPIGAAESAKTAVLDADVREVDVAIDDVGDDVADLSLPQFVGCHEQWPGNRRRVVSQSRSASCQEIFMAVRARDQDISNSGEST